MKPRVSHRNLRPYRDQFNYHKVIDVRKDFYGETLEVAGILQNPKKPVFSVKKVGVRQN